MNGLDRIFLMLTILAALGSGLIAGAFFAFSTFVMKALARIPASSGISAMQSINIVVINPAFLGVFIGTAALCAVLMIGAIVRWEKPGAVYLVAGALLYVFGTFLVTVLCNVPLNNSLAMLSPIDAEASTQWAHYVRRWTFWNHIRTAAALGAMGSFVMALRS